MQSPLFKKDIVFKKDCEILQTRGRVINGTALDDSGRTSGRITFDVKSDRYRVES